jgi:hypothetical protein
MDLWKPFAGLGVTGAALGLFYNLYNKFDWPLSTIPPDKMFWLLIVFMAIIAVVVMTVVIVHRPQRNHPPPKAPDSVDVSVPKGWSFEAMARSIGNTRIVQFEGFTGAEMAAELKPQDFQSPNDLEAIKSLRALANGQLRPYDVVQDTSGKFIVRVI